MGGVSGSSKDETRCRTSKVGANREISIFSKTLPSFSFISTTVVRVLRSSFHQSEGAGTGCRRKCSSRVARVPCAELVGRTLN
eukprot:16877_1